jgi:hypothetical protein
LFFENTVEPSFSNLNERAGHDFCAFLTYLNDLFMALRLHPIFVWIFLPVLASAQENPVFIPQPSGKKPKEERFDPKHYTDESVYAPICFGYGLRFPIRNYSTKLPASDSNAFAGWQQTRPGHVVDLSLHPGKKRDLNMGISFLFQRLDKASDEKVIDPPGNSSGNLLPLTLKLDKRASLFGNSLFLEHRFFPLLSNHVWLYVRADGGYIRYGAHASVFYRDLRGTMQYVTEARTASTVINGSLGFGLQLQHRMVGLKLLLGYQFQKANSFITNNQFNAWQAGFNAAKYDFKGHPDRSLFSVQQSEYEKVSSINSQVYFQMTAYFDLGW